MFERLTRDELALVQRSPQELPHAQRVARARILFAQLQVDSKWGFYEATVWAAVRRWVYRHLAHRFHVNGRHRS